MKRPVGLLLAAGAARRYGRAKQVETLADGRPLVRHAALAALAVCSEVRVVIGAHRDLVTAALAGLPVTIVEHEDWARGIGASIACGARSLIADGIAAPLLLCLADQPRVDAGALKRLLAAAEGRPDSIVVADYGVGRGPPCLFPPRLFAELAVLDGDEGARSLLKAHAAEVLTVSLPEGADDIDTPDDYRRIVGA